MPDPKDQRFAEITRRAITSFVPAVKSASLYSLLGLVIGGLLLWWYVVLEHRVPLEHRGTPSLLMTIVEHLATGFIVAAIAVFFYEWGAHIKETMHLTRSLVDIFDTQITPLTTAVGEDGLKRVLNELIMKGATEPSTEAAKVTASTTELVEAVSGLQNAEAWGSRQYLGFVAYQLRGVVANARALREVVRSGKGQHNFQVEREAAEIADRMLSAQMEAMGKGDSYDVISSIPTWRPNHLKKFEKSTQEAVQLRGVTVRRIFNLLRYRNQQATLSEDEVRGILETHLGCMTNWSTQDGYQARVMGEEECVKLESATVDRLRAAHFGVFRHRESAKEVHVRFWVEQADLSNMRMAKNDPSTTDDLELFDTLWSQATPLSKEAIPAIVTRVKEMSRKAPTA